MLLRGSFRDSQYIRCSKDAMRCETHCQRGTKGEARLFPVVPVALLARLVAFGPELFVDRSLFRAQHGVDLFNLRLANLAHLFIRLMPDLVENLPQLSHLI